MTNLKNIIDRIDALGDGDAREVLRRVLESEELIKSKNSKAWKASTDLTDAQRKAIKEHMDQGYSEREAHRKIGTHKEHKDLQSAMKSGIDPSPISDKHRESLLPLVQKWLEHADKYDKLNADVSKNPMKYASGQMMQAHGDATAGYHTAYSDFLNSDNVKGLKGHERFKAVQDWKKNWKSQNPNYEAGLTGVSEKQKTFNEARETSKTTLAEIQDHIMRGGISTPGVSAAEAAKQLGQESKGEEVAPTTSTVDIASSFARKNPKLVEKLNQEHMAQHKERLQRVDSHAAANNVVRRRKKVEEPK